MVDAKTDIIKTIAIIISILSSLDLFAQTKADNFNHEVTKVTGDLNEDKLVDKVVVLQDTTNDKAPYKLQIFFKQKNGGYKLIASSTKAINPEFPDGRKGFDNGNAFVGVTIKNGLVVSFPIFRANQKYKMP
jgi:hypothetical protein